MEEAARSFSRYFAPSIEALEKLLEKDLIHWNKLNMEYSSSNLISFVYKN